ncbi:DAZ associated protein 2 (dazap2) [Mactra antiquata]
MSGKPYPTAPSLGGPGYPTQQGPYPTTYPQPQYQTGYPYQQPYGQQPPMQQPYPNPPPYQESPPPYSTSAVPTQHRQPPYQQGLPPQPHYPQQPTTVVAPGCFDGGARFDGIAQPRIPPPPPGVAPSAVQLAAMQGHNVVGTQQNTSWLTGNRNDGGYSWGF